MMTAVPQTHKHEEQNHLDFQAIHLMQPCIYSKLQRLFTHGTFDLGIDPLRCFMYQPLCRVRYPTAPLLCELSEINTHEGSTFFDTGLHHLGSQKCERRSAFNPNLCPLQHRHGQEVFQSLVGLLPMLCLTAVEVIPEPTILTKPYHLPVHLPEAVSLATISAPLFYCLCDSRLRLYQVEVGGGHLPGYTIPSPAHTPTGRKCFWQGPYRNLRPARMQVGSK